MEFQDKMLQCADCGSDFVFTAGEQMFYYDKQFKNQPKRCRNCKAKRIGLLNQSSSHSRSRAETRTRCNHCGKETVVPFRPSQGRPVFCQDCFMQHKRTAVSA